MSPRMKTGKRTNFPTRLLTAARRIKILQFKNFCKTTETDNGVPGSETWISALLEFMNEGRKLTIENVNGWIRMHPWVSADDSCGFNLRETSNHVNIMPIDTNQNGNQIFSGHGGSSTLELQMLEDEDSHDSTSSQFSGVTQNTDQHGDNHTHTFPIGWTQQSQSQSMHQLQRHGNLQSYYPNANNSDTVRVIYLTQDPRNGQGNGNHSQFKEIGDANANTNNLYSEEVLAGLAEVMKHLAKLAKFYTKLECVRTLLVPLDKMVTTVQRNIRKCTMPKQHKDALAAKTGQLRQIKMEHEMNGQGPN